ncbi:hypothetical protein HDV00_004871 [Rhizophlyctis rosea]|nr:hypothetical protein HDV00_004871 [Rhizophlyctis rosea]
MPPTTRPVMRLDLPSISDSLQSLAPAAEDDSPSALPSHVAPRPIRRSVRDRPPTPAASNPSAASYFAVQRSRSVPPPELRVPTHLPENVKLNTLSPPEGWEMNVVQDYFAEEKGEKKDGIAYARNPQRPAALHRHSTPPSLSEEFRAYPSRPSPGTPDTFGPIHTPSPSASDISNPFAHVREEDVHPRLTASSTPLATQTLGRLRSLQSVALRNGGVMPSTSPPRSPTTALKLVGDDQKVEFEELLKKGRGGIFGRKGKEDVTIRVSLTPEYLKSSSGVCRKKELM